MTLVTGTKIGRYEIRSKIGEGGMGVVYLAQDTELERTVALKVLPTDVAADQQRMNRFVQEAKAASEPFNESLYKRASDLLWLRKLTKLPVIR